METTLLTDTCRKEVVEENELNVKGDITLLDIDKKSNFSKEQLVYWSEELSKIYPNMDEPLIRTIIDCYSTHPHVVDNLAEEHKTNPEKFPKKNEPLEFPKDSEWSVC